MARFFDPRRYDLAAVGRYKINKKLNVKTRLLNQTIAEPLVDPETGEILVEAGTIMTRSGLSLLFFKNSRLLLQLIQIAS
ncbi:DNA-directed RNA polymerase subunit beta [Streptococcus pneumoniae]|nr:DNA-directed RNA polymerase subunit beta [Streptococcus pneumoniae]